METDDGTWDIDGKDRTPEFNTVTLQQDILQFKQNALWAEDKVSEFNTFGFIWTRNMFACQVGHELNGSVSHWPTIKPSGSLVLLHCQSAKCHFCGWIVCKAVRAI